jgi:heme-degrading monooxygenase HmoA
LIVRVLHGRVKADSVSLFRERSSLALARTRRHDGCCFAQVGRQVHKDGSEEIIFLSVWNDLEAVYDWVGGMDLRNAPVIAGDVPEVFAYFDIQHYEVVDQTVAGVPLAAAGYSHES